ncbi:unnamed protein product [Chrysodeixis includens]|uniref:Uncharacterized protein n=1 Tax=Chrysodeixis includens TaxID=689277 RepID=A0A9P0G0K9_CHRIL|nr:unnamed protein product [Chrysodeixis includens]
MASRILLILSCTILAASAWSPYHPGPRGPMRFTRYAPSPHQLRQHLPPHPHLHSQLHPHLHAQIHPQHLHLHSQPHSQPHLQAEHKNPVESAEVDKKERQRPKRGHDDYDHDHDYDSDHKGTSGVTGPVHTFVKTDKNANYKWGVRHHVGDKYAS